MKLYQSPVVFDEEQHTYTLGNQQLSGVTSIIGRYVFPNKYANIDPEVLHKAAAKGTLVHDQLEELFLFKEILSGEVRDEVKAYQQLAIDNNLNQIAAEYLVDSPDDGIASKIDNVLRVSDNVYDLADFKTTCRLDKSYLSWQLSIYAYLFEFRNPTMYVRNLYGIHLRNSTAKLVEVKRIPLFAIKQLLLTYQLGLDEFENPMK